MRKAILASMSCIATLFFCQPTYAQQSRQARELASFSPGRTAMKSDESYYITYSCEITRDLKQYVSSNRWGRHPFSAATVVFALVDGSTDVSSGLFVPGTANAANPRIVYSVSSDRGVIAETTPRSCFGSLIAQKSDVPKLAYFVKFNRQTVPGPISAVVATILTAISPVFKLVKDNPMSEKDKENLDQVKTLLDQYNSYLALFTAPEYAAKAELLKVGTNVLRTEAATVTVTVRKVDSFLLDKQVPFISEYDKLFKTNMTYKADNLSSSCSFARRTLNTAGFRSPDDQAYIIYRSIDSSVIKSRDDMVKCLGLHAVPSVVKYRHLYLKHIPDDLLVNQATLDDLAKEGDREKVDAGIRVMLFDVARRAGSSTQGVIPHDIASGLARHAEDIVTVTDYSADQILSPGIQPESVKSVSMAPLEMQLSRLIASKFTRFGCFVLTRSEVALDRAVDGATAVLLANRPATKDVAARTVALRIYVNGTKITGYDVTDNWVPETRKAYAKDNRECQI
ncbi:hypothetical protein EN837_03615 [bacterium M00.F.Ca.ET.194.01.1.1]|nr:hypothetical protein EN837_03615 [bacterium M00.F.Ca.ET.194.01.1.1]